MTTRTRKGSPTQPQRQAPQRKSAAAKKPTDPVRTQQDQQAPQRRRAAMGGYGLAGWTGAQPEIEKPTKSAQTIADRELARIRGKK